MKRQYRYAIIMEEDKDGFFAMAPELQGCYASGDTYEEAMSNIKDVIKLNLEDRLADKENIYPAKSISLSTVEVAA